MTTDRRLAAGWAAITLIALAAAYWVLVPHDPAGPVDVSDPDPTAGLSDDDLARIELFGSWVDPVAVALALAPVVVLVSLGLTPLGTRLAERVGTGLRLSALRVIVVTFVVVAIAWALTLPLELAREVVRNQAGSISGGWPAWLVRRMGELAGWWALASLGVLLVALAARLLPRRWWLALSLLAGGVVTAASWVNGTVSLTGASWPSLPDGTLRTEVLVLADELGVSVRDVQLVPETPTTTIYNAYVTGFGERQVVVLYETLLVRSTPSEARAVVAHELGHVAAHDAERRAVLNGLAVAAGVALVAVAASSRGMRRQVGLKGRTTPESWVGGLAGPSAVPLLVALGVGFGSLLLPVIESGNRATEVRADVAALQATDDPEALAGVVRRAAVLNLMDPHPPWLERLTAGHPSPAERVALAERWDSTQPER